MKKNKSNVLYIDTTRTISRSFARFLTIVLICALGVSFFAGFSETAPAMKKTAREYYKDSNAADIRIISSCGFSNDDVNVIKTIPGLEGVMGEKFVDAVCKVNDENITDVDGSRMTVRAYSLDINKAISAAQMSENDRSFINRPQLIDGNWPAKSDECLVDESTLSTPEQFKIGAKITLDDEMSDVDSAVKQNVYTVVGVIRTPLYISYQRGNTTIGTGKLGTFMYIPSDNFLMDYYSAVSIRVAGSDKYDPYTDEYEDFIKPYTEYLNQISLERATKRAKIIMPTYTQKVSDGERLFGEKKVEVEQKIAAGAEQVKTILDLAENGDAKLAEYKKEYNEKATEADTKIGDTKVEHSTQYATWEQKRQEYNEAKELVDKYSSAETDFKTAQMEYNVANQLVTTLSSTVDYLQSVISATRGSINQLNEDQSTSVGDIIRRFEGVKSSGEADIVAEEVDKMITSIRSMTAVGTAEEISAYLEPQLQNLEGQLANTKLQLIDARSKLEAKKVQLDKAEQLVEKLKVVRGQLSSAQVALEQAEKELTNAGYDIQLGELEVMNQLSDKKNQITNFETNLALAKAKKDTCEEDFQKAKNEANSELEKAKNRLNSAKNFLVGLDTPSWTVQSRNDDALVGFKEYGGAIEKTRTLSIVVPWFFFLVATLVSLNTMTRMVEEERTQIGTLKAVGLFDSEIIQKYIFYALIASFVGSFSGTFLGFAVFPKAITAAFGILFDMAPLLVGYNFLYALLGIVLSVGLTVGATYFVITKSLKTHPSELMKPKAPKGGNRILLEKFPKLWTRLSFSAKVTCRNIFRNKRRFLMGVVGVMGTTAILVTAIGLDNSINDTIKEQFSSSSPICTYDTQYVLATTYEKGDQTVKNILANQSEIKSCMLEYMKVYDTTSDKSDNEMETYIYVPEDELQLPNYIRVRKNKKSDDITLPADGCVITNKLAKKLKIGVGDTITVNIDSTKKVNIPVSAISENYVFHYLYLSPVAYETFFGAAPRYNYAVSNYNDDLKPEQESEIAQNLLKNFEITAVSSRHDVQKELQNTINSMKIIVGILLVCGAMLSAIVIYSLSSININEKTKEIATLKVLGFSKKEVRQYVFRENILLSVIGTFFGLFLGKLVHKLVIFVADVSTITYGKSVGFLGFLLAAVLSIVFTILINLALRRLLNKIDMVESLKSNE